MKTFSISKINNKNCNKGSYKTNSLKIASKKAFKEHLENLGKKKITFYMKCKEDGKEYGPITALKGGDNSYDSPKTPNGKGTKPINPNMTEVYDLNNYNKVELTKEEKIELNKEKANEHYLFIINNLEKTKQVFNHLNWMVQNLKNIKLLSGNSKRVRNNNNHNQLSNNSNDLVELLNQYIIDFNNDLSNINELIKVINKLILIYKKKLDNYEPLHNTIPYNNRDFSKKPRFNNIEGKKLF
jgi:hypothetical protein